MVYGLDAKDQQLMVLALVLALGVLAVLAVQALMIPQQAAAAGCAPLSTGYNASAGRCFR